MHRRHRQRGDVHVTHQSAAPDRIAGGIDDDAGDDGCAPLDGFHRRRHQVAIFLLVERMPLACRTARRHAVAAGADQPVDLGANKLEIDLAVFPERRCHRRYHACGAYFHEPALAVSIRYPRVASRVPGSFFGRLEASLLKGGAVIQLARAIAPQGSIASSAHVEPSASASDLLTGSSINAEEAPVTHWHDT